MIRTAGAFWASRDPHPTNEAAMITKTNVGGLRVRRGAWAETLIGIASCPDKKVAPPTQHRTVKSRRKTHTHSKGGATIRCRAT